MDDLKANTEYTGYTAASSVVQWFWEVVRSFNKEDMARLLQFITGTSKVKFARNWEPIFYKFPSPSRNKSCWRFNLKLIISFAKELALVFLHDQLFKISFSSSLSMDT